MPGAATPPPGAGPGAGPGEGLGAGGQGRAAAPRGGGVPSALPAVAAAPPLSGTGTTSCRSPACRAHPRGSPGAPARSAGAAAGVRPRLRASQRRCEHPWALGPQFAEGHAAAPKPTVLPVSLQSAEPSQPRPRRVPLRCPRGARVRGPAWLGQPPAPAEACVCSSAATWAPNWERGQSGSARRSWVPLDLASALPGLPGQGVLEQSRWPNCSRLPPAVGTEAAGATVHPRGTRGALAHGAEAQPQAGALPGPGTLFTGTVSGPAPEAGSSRAGSRRVAREQAGKQ